MDRIVTTKVMWDRKRGIGGPSRKGERSDDEWWNRNREREMRMPMVQILMIKLKLKVRLVNRL